ncbi:MAG: App1 family protein [Anaerolineae bacterium]
MADWQKVLAPMVRNVEEHFDRLKYDMVYRMWGPDPIKIVPYRGFGTRDRLYIKGRVLERKNISESTQNDTVWRNLVSMYRRMESDEVPYARLVARFQDVEREVVADEEGYFDLWLEPTKPLEGTPSTTGEFWPTVEFELVSPTARHQQGPVRATGQILVPAPTARYIVISDIDDTVIRTEAMHLLHMARIVFLGNAHTRMPFPGVAAFYRALYAGAGGSEHNPLFYVSSSPWNLYDLLEQFFQLNDIPIGPVLFLRDWGVTREELLPTKHRDHKLSIIRQMLEIYADMPLILIGDSGQHDPEIYAQVVRENRDRVIAIYIRNVVNNSRRADEIRKLAEEVVKAGSALLLADDTLAAARHAAEHGWISPEALTQIADEKAFDEAPPTPLEKVLGEGEAPVAPEIEVRGEHPGAERAVQEGAVEQSTKEPRNTDEEAPVRVRTEDKR